MDLINRHRKYYGIPSKLNASEPEYDIKFSIGGKEYEKQAMVRGQKVCPTRIKNSDNHVLCQMQDLTWSYVNPANITYERL